MDGFNVTQKIIRDSYQILLKKQKKTKAAEERVSDIAPFNDAIAEIDELFLESELERNTEL